jgi:lysophospholipase L1-like esterase
LGFRDDEHPFDRRHDVRRLVILGDSFAFGQGVDFGERFTEVIERSAGSIEAINLAVFGYGTDQEVLLFESLGVRFRPDAVILVAFPWNDLEDIACIRRHSFPKPYFRLQGGVLDLVPPGLDLLTALRTHSYVVERILRVIEPPEGHSQRAPEWTDSDTVPLFVALVRRLAARATALPAHLLVLMVYPPDAEKSPRPENVRRILDGLEEEGIAVLDTYDALVNRQKTAGQIYLPDRHWSPDGHRLMAGLLLAELAARKWL